MRDVRDVDRQLLLDDTAGLAHMRPGMPLGDVHPLHDEPALLGKDTQDLASSALVAAADDDDAVALLDLQLRHGSLPVSALSARLRGEREGTHRVSDGEGEVGWIAVASRGSPHLTPALSAPWGGEGEPAADLVIGIAIGLIRGLRGPTIRSS